MDAAKIRLSPEEAALVKRADWILTKNRIIQKTKSLLELLQNGQQVILAQYAQQLRRDIPEPPAKISKGENYRGLPYLVLDHPRYFQKENIFAIRTLFWWGNFFSCTLHLSGEYKKDYEKKIIASFRQLQEAGLYISHHDNQWEHHFEADNYIALLEISATDFEKIILDSSFIKLSGKISLERWETAEKDLLEIFRQLISVIN